MREKNHGRIVTTSTAGLLGNPGRGRPGTGLFLGAFLNLLGWVMILQAPPIG